MSVAEDNLKRDQAVRDRARTAFNGQLERVKADLAAKGVGARAKDCVVDEAREIAETGVDIARERKGIVAGTIGALLLWLFRVPLARQIGALLDRAGLRDR